FDGRRGDTCSLNYRLVMTLIRTAILLSISIAVIENVTREKSYQAGLLAFSEWDLNHDCIVTYEEFKHWVLDMLMAVYTYQALVSAEEGSKTDLKDSTYDRIARRVIDDLGRLATQNANVTVIMSHLLSKIHHDLETTYNSTSHIARIFKFNSRLNLTFWYNL
ncbi:hypothetical protein PFISCL1PPCAC_27988, partial [Pristionchus fissidentatus]